MKKKKIRELAKKKSNQAILIGIVFILLATVVLCLYLTDKAIRVGAQAASDTYEQTKSAVASNVYQRFYDVSYQRAEEKNHVSNDATISIRGIREEGKLEVLKVWDVVYVVEERTSNEQKIEVWSKFPGYGVFTVDLQRAEITIDQYRKIVDVKLPSPRLTSWSIDNERVEAPLHWDNDVFNDSISAGVSLAQSQRQEAYQLLGEQMSYGDRNNQAAKHSAQLFVEGLIRAVNKDVSELTVIVDFYE